MPAQQPARDLLASSQGHPVAAMPITEFGNCPRGCFVRLASGFCRPDSWAAIVATLPDRPVNLRVPAERLFP